MNGWIIDQNIERFERLLKTDLDALGRATIMKLLQLERARTPWFLPKTDA